MCLQNESLDNSEGKGEIACNEQFLLYSRFFFFLPFGALSTFFIEFEIVDCKVSQFGGLKILAWERFNRLVFELKTSLLLGFVFLTIIYESGTGCENILFANV